MASTSVSTPLGAARTVDSHSGLEWRRGATAAAVRTAGTSRGPSLDHDRETERRCRRSCRRDYTAATALQPATHHRRSESVPVVVAKINATASPSRAFVRPTRALPKRFRIDTDLPVALRATGRNTQCNARNIDRSDKHA